MRKRRGYGRGANPAYSIASDFTVYSPVWIRYQHNWAPVSACFAWWNFLNYPVNSCAKLIRHYMIGFVLQRERNDILGSKFK